MFLLESVNNQEKKIIVSLIWSRDVVSESVRLQYDIGNVCRRHIEAEMTSRVHSNFVICCIRICMSCIYLFIYIFIYLFIYLFSYLFICLFVYLKLCIRRVAGGSIPLTSTWHELYMYILRELLKGQIKIKQSIMIIMIKNKRRLYQS